MANEHHKAPQNLHFLPGSGSHKLELQARSAKRWFENTGRQVDVIVVGPGSGNVLEGPQLMELLWPAVKPGGFYFMEFGSNYSTSDGGGAANTISAWIERFLIRPEDRLPAASHHPLPPHASFLFCQSGGCVVSKSKKRQTHALRWAQNAVGGALIHARAWLV